MMFVIKRHAKLCLSYDNYTLKQQLDCAMYKKHLLCHVISVCACLFKLLYAFIVVGPVLLLFAALMCV